MKLRRYAILIDGGFVIKVLQQRLGHFPSAQDIAYECERIKASPIFTDYELFRIYFYHAPPIGITLENPIDKSRLDLATSKVFSSSKGLLDALEMKPDFALRLGETVARGWKLGKAALKGIEKTGTRALTPEDLEPNISQKGVDLRIGLDIARLALREIVGAIVVMTGDSDMIPAFKFARREGLRVYLDHLGNPVTRDLLAHTDLVF